MNIQRKREKRGERSKKRERKQSENIREKLHWYVFFIFFVCIDV